MSYARFSTDDFTGKIRGYVGDGQFTDDPLETFGGAGVVEIPRMQDLLRYICERGFEHHVAANFSLSAAVMSRSGDALSWLGHLLAQIRSIYMGTIVAGVDFGTLNVRVSIFDSERGPSGRGVGRIPAASQAE